MIGAYDMDPRQYDGECVWCGRPVRDDEYVTTDAGERVCWDGDEGCAEAMAPDAVEARDDRVLEEARIMLRLTFPGDLRNIPGGY